MTTHRVVGLVAAVLLLAGCTNGATPDTVDDPNRAASTPPTTAEAPSYQRYVALGDSFTAAPYVPTTDLAEGCLRSTGNYPALVAERLAIPTLVDVSCSGADTRDLVRPQNTFRDATVPPQLDAVTADTDLVTLGIGGNDFDLFVTLLQTCIQLGAGEPTGRPCTDYLDANGTDLRDQISRITRRVAAALDRIQRRAPEAEVLLVGYPRIVPTDRTCPRLLPLADGDYLLAARVSKSLDRALTRAARQAGVELVDMYRASRGHDVCSDDPWVNGQVTDQAAALAFHPFAAGMDAVADRVVARLR
jgi:lysophospholipase L1-like esterase